MVIPDPVATGVVLASALQIAKQAQDFIAAASGHPGETMGTILGNIAQRRIRNGEVVVNKAYFTLLNIGVTPGEIPLNVLQPALEAASLAEDAEMQERWTNLLANAADPGQQNKVSPAFPSILKELTSREVKFLDALFTHYSKVVAESNEMVGGPDYKRVLTENHFRLVLYTQEHLLKIFSLAGLSRSPATEKWWEISGGPDAWDLDALEDIRILMTVRDLLSRHNLIALGPDLSPEYSITLLGWSFVKACRTPTAAQL